MTHNLSEVELTIVEMFQECCLNARECAVNNKEADHTKVTVDFTRAGSHNNLELPVTVCKQL